MIPGVIGGMILAKKMDLQCIPQFLAISQMLTGLSILLLGWSSFLKAWDVNSANNIETFLTVFVGSVTSVGSILAYLKL